MNAVAAIAQCPYTGVNGMPTDLTTLKVGFYAVIDWIKQSLGLKPLYIPAATGPGRVGGLTTAGCEEGLARIAKNPELVFSYFRSNTSADYYCLQRLDERSKLIQLQLGY